MYKYHIDILRKNKSIPINSVDIIGLRGKRDRLSPNTRFDNEGNLNKERLLPFRRIVFVTISSRMKEKLDKRNHKAIIVGIPKYHSSDNYCTTQTTSIIYPIKLFVYEKDIQ